MVPPPPLDIDGTRPYFFSIGQSAGPMRSNPLMPTRRLAAAVLEGNATSEHAARHTLLERPLRGGAGACSALQLPRAIAKRRGCAFPEMLDDSSALLHNKGDVPWRVPTGPGRTRARRGYSPHTYHKSAGCVL